MPSKPENFRSQFSLTQTLESVAQPSNEVISLLDPQTNRWIDGKINREFDFVFRIYSIRWNGRLISKETKYNPFHTEFYDRTNDALLARVNKRLLSLLWANTYDLETLSDDVPIAVYLLALAAHDHIESQCKASSGSSSSSKKVCAAA